MKKLLFLVTVSIIFSSCSNSFMKKPISKTLSNKEIQNFSAIAGKDNFNGEGIYENIRDCVDELFNKPSNVLSVNETKAISLCDKITYQDFYDFHKESEKVWCQSFKDNAKKLQFDPEENRVDYDELYMECLQLTEQDVIDNLQSKYPDIVFLLQTTDNLF